MTVYGLVSTFLRYFTLVSVYPLVSEPFFFDLALHLRISLFCRLMICYSIQKRNQE